MTLPHIRCLYLRIRTGWRRLVDIMLMLHVHYAALALLNDIQNTPDRPLSYYIL